MKRRDFLHPRQLARTAGQVLGVLNDLGSLEAESPPEEIALLRVARGAMATTFEILLPYGIPCAFDAAAAALDEIDRLEDQLTVFREHSEVSRLNRTAALGPVPVEEGLFGLLEQSARLHRETGGAFDVTAGALTKAWGFYRRQQRMPSTAERREALSRVGMGYVVLDREAQTVRYLRLGLEINLGSIGKGYALDRAAGVLRTEWKLSAALLHGGHSSIYAIGTPPGEVRGWAVGIAHPWQPERRLATVRLRDRALGTSAATFQHLSWGGRKLGHILDPRTGWPAEGVASASAVAPTAALADALATAFFILGAEQTRAYCEAHPGIGAVLLPSGDGALPLTFGLADELVEMASPRA